MAGGRGALERRQEGDGRERAARARAQLQEEASVIIWCPSRPLRCGHPRQRRNLGGVQYCSSSDFTLEDILYSPFGHNITG